jgi:hypothetical protein
MFQKNNAYKCKSKVELIISLPLPDCFTAGKADPLLPQGRHKYDTHTHTHPFGHHSNTQRILQTASDCSHDAADAKGSYSRRAQRWLQEQQQRDKAEPAALLLHAIVNHKSQQRILQS